jgi:hypothetical protein
LANRDNTVTLDADVGTPTRGSSPVYEVAASDDEIKHVPSLWLRPSPDCRKVLLRSSDENAETGQH